MKLKSTLLALALLGITGASNAAPSLQSCNPMEVLHNGTSGLSYKLDCEAGDWKLSYTGSVPAGNRAVLAQYSLSVQSPKGENFTNARQVRLAEPALLGQSLLREAVLLDNGDLALRACDQIGCTQYRPLGSAKAGLTEATITGSQEILKLKREVLRLDDLATSRGDALDRAKEDLDRRKAAVVELELQLGRVSSELTQVKVASATQTSDLQAQLLAANEKASAAQQVAQTATAAREPQPTAVEPSISKNPDFTQILDLTEVLAQKNEQLKLVQEETVAKLERAQNEAAMASARLEALKLTLQLTSQTLAVAHSDLDSARYELAQLKKDRVAPAAAEPLLCAKGTNADDLAKKDALIGRVSAALVNANVELTKLKAEMAKSQIGKVRPK